MRRGTRVGEAYVSITADGSGINEEIVNGVDDAGDDIDKKGDEQGDSYGDHFSEGFLSRMKSRIREKFGHDVGDELSKAGDDGGDSFGKGFTAKIESYMDDEFAQGIADRFATSFVNKLESRLGQQGGVSSPLAALFDRMMNDVDKGVSGNASGPSVSQVVPGSTRRTTQDTTRGLGDVVGTLLGAGSRNNALNLLGKSIGGIITLGEKLFTEGGGGIDGFLKNIAEHGPAAAAATGAVVVAMSLLATTISALLGVATALLSTIATGLTGALGIAAGAAGDLAFGLGAVVLGMASLGTAQKAALKITFKPLIQELEGLGQEFDQSLIPYTSRWSTNLQGALTVLAPLMQRLGTTFGQFGDEFTASLSGKGWTYFFNQLDVYLPDILAKFGDAFTHTMSGLASLFGVLQPYVDRFAKSIDSTATRFDNWAASASGRNGIVSFFDKAVISAESLWGWIKEVGGLLSDVLFSNSGNAAGDNLFDAWSASIDRFRKRIADGSLDHWFAQAQTFGHALGQVFSALGDIFDALVNDGSLTIVLGLLKAFVTVAQAASPIIADMLSALTPLISLVQGLANAFAALPGPMQAALISLPIMLSLITRLGPIALVAKGALGDLAAGFALFREEAAANGLASAFSSIPLMAPKIAALTKTLGGAALAFGGFELATQHANNEAALFGGTAAAALGGFMLGGPIGAALAGGTTLVMGLYNSLKQADSATTTFVNSLNTTKLGGFSSAVSQLEGAMSRLNSTYAQDASGNAFSVGWKALTDSGFRQGAADLNALNNEFPKLRQQLIVAAQGIGLNTAGWDSLTGSALKAKAVLTDITDSLHKMGLQTDSAGNVITNLHNALVGFAGKDYLDISKTGLQELLGDLDSVQPSKLAAINAQLRALWAVYQSPADFKDPSKAAKDLQAYLDYVKGVEKQLGSGALDQTFTAAQLQVTGASGGAGSALDTATWTNPYIAYANSIMSQGPSVSATITNAYRTANKDIQNALNSENTAITKMLTSAKTSASKAILTASKATTASSAQTTLAQLATTLIGNANQIRTTLISAARTQAEALKTAAANAVSTAEQAVQSAASTLASATDPKTAAKDLAALQLAQRNLAAAKNAQKTIDAQANSLIANAKAKAAASNAQIKAANAIIKGQEKVNNADVNALLAGFKDTNATLADYAAARAKLATELQTANTKLQKAISLRDDYKTQVAQSIEAFGALTTAQAQVIDGVTQAMTSNDIISNLQTKLKQIKDFQTNLRILLAQGLSNSAYKQLVDAGVDAGGQYAQALVNGGVGAVQQVNSLVGQIDTASTTLGTDSSQRLYQAGVTAAQAVVNGLKTQDAALNKQAQTLSDKVTKQVKAALGDKTKGSMHDAGVHAAEGLIAGLNSKGDAVAGAAYGLGEKIAKNVNKALGIHSPSRVLMASMDHAGDGIVIGLGNQGTKVGNAASALASKINVSPEVAAYASRQGNDASVSGNGGSAFRDLIVHTPTENPEAVAHEVVNEIVGRL